MNKKIVSRVKKEADYIIKTQSTIRNTAKVFKISKSTVHKDIKDRLKLFDYDKYMIIQDIFKEHIKLRHIIGGQSTKMKYLKKKYCEG